MSKASSTTRAAVYARISSDRDDGRLGVDRQEKDCRQLCAERGWQVAGVYVDNNISASSGVDRPEYQRLLRDVKRGAVDAVAVWDLDRLTRRPIELEQFVTACDQAGVTQLAFVGGGVDMGTGDGLLVARIKGAVAAEEARKTSQRIRRKHLELAEKGLSSGGGTRAFGFNEDQVTVRETEAELIREAATRVLAGESLYSIRQDWNQRPVPTVTGKPWSVTAIKAFLIRPRTAGLRQHQGEWSWDRPAVWPAILDPTTWEQVRAVLTDPSRRQPAPSRAYPLRGILTCGECGRHLTAMPRRGGRNYGCRKEGGGCGKVFIKADNVERYVFDTVLPLVDHPGLRGIVSKEEEADANEVRRLVTENAADEKMLTQLDEDYTDRAIPRSTYLKQSQRLRARIDTRHNQLASLRGRTALDHLSGHVAEKWNSLSADEKRMIIGSLVPHVKVNRAARNGSNAFDTRRIHISWRFGILAKLGEDALHRWDSEAKRWVPATEDELIESMNADLSPAER